MNSLTDILARPVQTSDFMPIHPIKIRDWDVFEEISSVLLISKEGFEKNDVIDKLDLLSLIFLADINSAYRLSQLFSICIGEEFEFVDEGMDSHYRSDNYRIDGKNYDEIRKIIMDQNLVFPPKVYKDPMVRKYAEKKIKQMQKNNPNVTLEDMISTVSSRGGKHPWELEEYTIYQLNMEFKRICQWEQWKISSAAQVHVEKDLDIDHFGEYINLRKDPYEDLFKDGAKNINKALGKKN